MAVTSNDLDMWADKHKRGVAAAQARWGMGYTTFNLILERVRELIQELSKRGVLVHHGEIRVPGELEATSYLLLTVPDRGNVNLIFDSGGRIAVTATRTWWSCPGTKAAVWLDPTDGDPQNIKNLVDSAFAFLFRS